MGNSKFEGQFLLADTVSSNGNIYTREALESLAKHVNSQEIGVPVCADFKFGLDSIQGLIQEAEVQGCVLVGRGVLLDTSQGNLIQTALRSSYPLYLAAEVSVSPDDVERIDEEDTVGRKCLRGEVHTFSVVQEHGFDVDPVKILVEE